MVQVEQSDRCVCPDNNFFNEMTSDRVSGRLVRLDTAYKSKSKMKNIGPKFPVILGKCY